MSARQRGRRGLSPAMTLTLGLLALGLFVAGIYFGFQAAKPPPPPDLSVLRPPENAPPEKAPAPEPPPALEPTEQPLDVERQPAPGKRLHPRIAIIIDDLGRSLQDLDALARLGVPLTYSVLPYEVKTSQVVAELRRRKVDYMCHLPMEAKNDHADPGPGALRLDMDHEELVAATYRALVATDGAVGVNNHMGSAISADRDAITTVLEVIHDRHLFYVDSRTGADTLGYSVARQLGMPAGERQVFLDTDPDAPSVDAQFDALLAVARQRGGAIAIGHPHPATLDVLAERIPEARTDGFEFVTVRKLLDGS